MCVNDELQQQLREENELIIKEEMERKAKMNRINVNVYYCYCDANNNNNETAQKKVIQTQKVFTLLQFKEQICKPRFPVQPVAVLCKLRHIGLFYGQSHPITSDNINIHHIFCNVKGIYCWHLCLQYDTIKTTIRRCAALPGGILYFQGRENL